MSEETCPTCGLPGWWVDNDCHSCGGMTIEEARKDVKA
jgi:DnaJ-class molecular chaperone